ncbi:hypothetical protein [Streptomyces sp. NBC_01237]|uniref:hypothetical protein n=1 Tax=Streptomyces sp. NBC_01237 TaxID=2903790 RepID=UPI002DD9D919|nr:hypothetical protein [Streptomyces sp. NBC_01237]WRZ77285.1 hypothetical protein OG251_37155 [Streptomyces sp. NBC_01237]
MFSRSVPSDDSAGARKEQWLRQPQGDGVFDQVEFVGHFAVLRWDTGRGGIALVHSMTDGNTSPKLAVAALRQHHGEHLAHQYACVITAQTRTQVTHPYVPQLHAYDVGGGGEPYETTWAHLAAVLGQRAPYWFHSLRDRDAISAWRPGAPPALVPAHDIATPVTALTELAADEPDGSAAAELCWYLARLIRYRDYTSTTRNIDELRKNAADGGDGAHLALGAVPAPLARPSAPQEPTELIRRAGWLSITERRDVLAYRVADFGQGWDGGQDWHTGAAADIRPSTCNTAREWFERLVPAVRDQPPTVLEKILLDDPRDPEADTLLHDPVAALPVLHRSPGTRNASLLTYSLQRLPTHSPLAGLILSAQNCWIRTGDGTLWLAPEREGWGIGYGYAGNGCHALAELVDVLLDDISAPAAQHSGPAAAPRGLFELLRHTKSAGTTTYTRAQLLDARSR